MPASVTSSRLVCAYCRTVNPRDEKHCLACGAPLPPSPQQVEPVTAARSLAPTVVAPTVVAPHEPISSEARKAAELADRVYDAAAQTYYIFWRTVSEALSISVTAFALGLVGSSTGMTVPGIVGAALVALVVSVTSKHTWLVAISAPLGLLLGCLVWVCPWVVGLGPQGMVFTGALAAAVAARLGASRVRRTWWDWLRPFLALAGALLFAALGSAIGLGLVGLVNTLVGGQ